jgi:hypothetical protein
VIDRLRAMSIDDLRTLVPAAATAPSLKELRLVE